MRLLSIHACVSGQLNKSITELLADRRHTMRLTRYANLLLRNALGTSVFVVLFFTPSIAESQSVGSCTPGRMECQADKLAECECFHQWSPDRGEKVLVCMWQRSDFDCGSRPPCDESREGRIWRTQNDSTICRCREDENGNKHCKWEGY
jgi:hypothetical protein